MARNESVSHGPLPASILRVAFVAISGSFLTQLDATVVNVSLATLAKELGTSLKVIQWVSSGYLLALALALPLSGWLVNRFGARTVYLICFSAFTTFSTLCGLAWSASSLIGFRAIQGISGGLLAPMTQMMMARAAGNQLPRVMGYVAMPILLAPMLGPVVAGLILQYLPWRALFFVNLPFGLLAISLAAFVLPNDREEDAARSRMPFDFVGFMLLSPGLVLFLYSINRLGGTPGTLALLAACCLLSGFAAWASHRGSRALIDLRLLSDRTFSTSVAIQFMSNGTALAGQVLIPIYLIRAGGYSPSQTGIILAPIGIGMLCAYPMLGRLTDRFGIRRVSTVGAALSAAATGIFVATAYLGFAASVLLPALFLRGIGMSLIGVPSVSAAYATVAPGDLPMASTTLNVVQRLGGPVLTTALASFLGWRLAVTPGAASGGAFGQSFALLCAFQVILVLLATRLPWRLVGEDTQLKDTSAIDPCA